ncbi:MAG: hypothetical protein QXG10_02615 [Candidatus Hadarchaeales archaeon]
MAEKMKEIERSAEEIVQSFVEAEKGLPRLEEAYYSHSVYNIVRADGKPTSSAERKVFREIFISNMPSSDDKGNLKVEVARWVK